MHPPANQGGDLTPPDPDGRRWHATAPGQTRPPHHPVHPPRLRDDGYAPWRTAFVRAAEVDALIVFLIALAIGCAWIAAGQGGGAAVLALAAAAGLLVGLGLIARQRVLDGYRDAAGRLEPHRPWWAR